MTTLADRMRMAAWIADFEARRDSKKRLAVYKLPAGDGGGKYEVAGINDRYHKPVVDKLVELIGKGQHDQAEQVAREYILQYTDAVLTWSTVAGVEFFLRDSAFNRGRRGAALILQMALGIVPDGVIGSATKAVLAQEEADPTRLLAKLRQAREDYEIKVAGKRAKFWKGLVNRWNKALAAAQTFLQEIVPVSAEPLIADASTREAVVIASPAAPPIAGPFDPILRDTAATLPALRLGMHGALIRAWQSFLIGQGFDPGGGSDGQFGSKTKSATILFQRAHGLAADGVVGRQTLIEAMRLGFEVMEEPAEDRSGSNFPPTPPFQPLVSTTQRQAVFGRFQFVHAPAPGNKERIKILGSWESENIVSVPIPQLRRVLGAGAPETMRFHKLAAEQLKGLWEDWERASLLDRVLSYEGAFVPRFIRGSTSQLSNHAFGTAFDINADTNGLGIRPPLLTQKGCVRELVPLAHKWGFYWGGHFMSRPDGMHFEVALLQ